MVKMALADDVKAAESLLKAKDAVFGREKAELNFLVSGGTAGFRNLSVEPNFTP